jgi:uncharacterized membrane protein YqhA
MEALLSLLFRAGRALVAVPVVVLTLGALAAFGYSGYLLVSVAVGIAQAPADSGRFVVTEVKVADTALIGIALFIAAAGLEELFLGGRAGRVRAGLPAWLAIDDLNDLKERLLATLVLVVVVTFVDQAVSAADGLRVLELGAATALVVTAVAVYLRLTGRQRGG